MLQRKRGDGGLLLRDVACDMLWGPWWPRLSVTEVAMTAGVWSRSRRATSGRDEGAEGRAPVGDRGPGLQRERHGGRYDIVFQVEKLRENQWWI